MPAEHDQVPEAVLGWLRAGRPAALATVIETWGSAPRPKGAQLAIGGEAEMVGSVSGGCVEGAVVSEALAALDDGQPRLLDFGVSDAEAFAVGLACGGRIRVMVEPVGIGQGPSADTPRAAGGRAGGAEARRLCGAAAVLGPAAGKRAGRPALAGGAGGADRRPGRASRATGSLASTIRRCGWRWSARSTSLRRSCPWPGWRGTTPRSIDPREAFASPARFPDATTSHDWPDEALAAFGLDTRTAVVTLTHDPKLDDPAIAAALRSPAFYIGCLGSSRTHAKRVDRLRAAGFAEEEIARIHAPVGADIGASAPAEIAIAILAEITLRLRRPETRP